MLYETVAKWEPNTAVPMACWYGKKERNMKKAIRELRRAFPGIAIHPFDDLGHGGIIDQEVRFVRELEAFFAAR